jgi:hypothetical protein
MPVSSVFVTWIKLFSDLVQKLIAPAVQKSIVDAFAKAPKKPNFSLVNY